MSFVRWRFSLLLLCVASSTRPSGPTSTARHGWDRPRAAPRVFRNGRGGGMSRCMRAPQVVRLCVPKLPCVAAAARRRCVRAACIASASRARALGMDKLSGCISRPSSCGDASHCNGLHIYAALHSSAATRCFLAVILASPLYRLLRCWSADVGPREAPRGANVGGVSSLNEVACTY